MAGPLSTIFGRTDIVLVLLEMCGPLNLQQFHAVGTYITAVVDQRAAAAETETQYEFYASLWLTVGIMFSTSPFVHRQTYEVFCEHNWTDLLQVVHGARGRKLSKSRGQMSRSHAAEVTSGGLAEASVSTYSPSRLCSHFKLQYKRREGRRVARQRVRQSPTRARAT